MRPRWTLLDWAKAALIGAAVGCAFGAGETVMGALRAMVLA